MVFYWPSIVTTALSCIICEINEILVGNRDFFIPLAFDTPVRGVPIGILPSHLVWENYNGGLPDGVKTVRIGITV